MILLFSIRACEDFLQQALCYVWLKRKRCILPKQSLSEADTLRFSIFPLLIFAFCFFSSWKLDVISFICLKRCSLFTPLPTLTSLTSGEFIHAYTSAVYLPLCGGACLSISQKRAAYLSPPPLSSSQHIYLTFSVFCLKSPQLTIYSGAAFHKCHSKTSFTFSDLSVRARARVS